MALITKTRTAGDWFQAQDFQGAKAILVEPKEFNRDVPNPTWGGVRDIVIADLTIFEDSAALDGTSEPTVLKRAQFDGRALVDEVKDGIGDQFVFGVKLKPNKRPNSRPYPIWANLDVSITEKVEAWLQRREAGVAADLDAGIPDEIFA